MARGILVVITAPSGCGKGALRRALMKAFTNLVFCPSVTTRAMRPGEVDGVDYFFVSQEDFASMVDKGELAEWAEVYGNRYGTPKASIEAALAKGLDVVLEKDVQGARTLRDVYPQGAFVFVLPPSLDELRRRITGRGTETRREMEIRFGNVEREISDLSSFDYVIINADLERAAQKLCAVVAAEKARSKD